MNDRGGAVETARDEQWCARLAADLAPSAGIDEELLGRELRPELLRLARDVAHGSERRNAPLATFIAGRYVEARRRQGVDPGTALTEVRKAAAALLPGGDAATPPPPPDG